MKLSKIGFAISSRHAAKTECFDDDICLEIPSLQRVAASESLVWNWNAPNFCTRGYESTGWGMNRVACPRVCCWSAGVAGAEAAHAAANWAGVW